MRKVALFAGLAVITFVFFYFIIVMLQYPTLGVKVTQEQNGRFVITELSSDSRWGAKHLQLGDQIIQINDQHPTQDRTIARYGWMGIAESVVILRQDAMGIEEQLHYTIGKEIPPNELVSRLLQFIKEEKP